MITHSTSVQSLLPEKEKEIVQAAHAGTGRSQGLVVFASAIGASYLIAGGKQWDFLDDNRNAAEYEEAIENLQRRGLLRHLPEGGYCLTAVAFRLGDVLNQSNDDSSA